MKKKGRICGIIGIVLSLALAGSTVVYASLLDENAVGKAEKPFADQMTGTVFGDLFGNGEEANGFEKTRRLVEDSVTLFTETSANAYTSYSLSFTVTESLTVVENVTGDDGNLKAVEKVTNTGISGVVYADENYTYLKYTERTVNDSVTAVSGEYLLDKSTAVWWECANGAGAAWTETAGDTRFELLKNSVWQKSPFDGEIPGNVLSLLAEQFSAAEGDAKIDLLGSYRFTPAAEGFVEGADKECEFTMGPCPMIVYTSSLDRPKTPMTGDAYGTKTIVFNYSKLNNTKIGLPESLEEAMK